MTSTTYFKLILNFLKTELYRAGRGLYGKFLQQFKAENVTNTVKKIN